jgi:hypothetical protein
MFQTSLCVGPTTRPSAAVKIATIFPSLDARIDLRDDSDAEACDLAK